MIKLELTEEQAKTQEGANDAAVRSVAQQLAQQGLPGLDQAINMLMAIRENQHMLVAAAKAASTAEPQPNSHAASNAAS